MIFKMFCIHDSKVGAYMQPFFARSIGDAMRSWTAVCNDGKSMMSIYPGDYTLFEIGSYSEDTGVVTPLDVLHSLGTGLEVKRSESPVSLVS